MYNKIHINDDDINNDIFVTFFFTELMELMKKRTQQKQKQDLSNKH